MTTLVTSTGENSTRLSLPLEVSGVVLPPLGFSSAEVVVINVKLLFLFRSRLQWEINPHIWAPASAQVAVPMVSLTVSEGNSTISDLSTSEAPFSVLLRIGRKEELYTNLRAFEGVSWNQEFAVWNKSKILVGFVFGSLLMICF